MGEDHREHILPQNTDNWNSSWSEDEITLGLAEMDSLGNTLRWDGKANSAAQNVNPSVKIESKYSDAHSSLKKWLPEVKEIYSVNNDWSYREIRERTKRLADKFSEILAEDGIKPAHAPIPGKKSALDSYTLKEKDFLDFEAEGTLGGTKSIFNSYLIELLKENDGEQILEEYKNTTPGNVGFTIIAPTNPPTQDIRINLGGNFYGFNNLNSNPGGEAEEHLKRLAEYLNQYGVKLCWGKNSETKGSGDE